MKRPGRASVEDEPVVIIECRRCLTRFMADLPGGTAVQCTRCGLVFKTPHLDRGDEVQVVGVEPGRGVFERPPRPRVTVPRLGDPERPPPPDVLEEIGDARTGRRWFLSRSVELIVWLSEAGEPRAFRLCYDKTTRERAVTFSDGRFSHAVVDSGEAHDDGAPGYKQTGMLVSETEFDTEYVVATFERVRGALPVELARFVERALRSRAPAPARPLN